LDSIDIIKKMPSIHCARGSELCEKCKIMAEEEEKFCLIRVYLKAGKVARPMTEIFVGCRRIFGEYDVVKVFKNDREAKEYAINNKKDITFT